MMMLEYINQLANPVNKLDISKLSRASFINFNRRNRQSNYFINSDR